MWRRLLPRLEAVSLGLWYGGVLFFAAFVATTAFSSLEQPHSGVFIRAVFPKYYTFGMVAGIATVLLTVASKYVTREWGIRAWLSIWLTVIMLVCTSLGPTWILPRMEELREMRHNAPPDSQELRNAEQYYQANHRLSVALTIIVLAVGMLVIFIPRSPATPSKPTDNV
ncbi:MAG: DUF4149 domain-containing protein [Candidatus Poribacteria bacterium]|nr:DUF4149 domain-containing protein [Candidatus Poribacteria bacterium]